MPADERIQARFRHNMLSTDPESLVKAAAWLWYLHGKGNGREGGYVYQMRNRERKESRFKSEALMKSLAGESFRSDFGEDVWDCDSSLYDSFELLSFSDRLNRNLTENPTISAPAACAFPYSPPRPSSDLNRNSAKPHRDFSASSEFSLSFGQSFPSSDAEGGESRISVQNESKWSIGGFVKALKKVATNTIRKRTKHRSSHELERYQQHQLSPYHHHQRHHYPIYHYLHRRYKAGEDILASIKATGKITESSKS